MGALLVQSKSFAADSGGVYAFDNDVIAGNFLVIKFQQLRYSSFVFPSLSDGRGNVWHDAVGSVDGSGYVNQGSISYVYNAAAGPTTITAVLSSNNGRNVVIEEWSGIEAGSDPFLSPGNVSIAGGAGHTLTGTVTPNALCTVMAMGVSTWAFGGAVSVVSPFGLGDAANFSSSVFLYTAYAVDQAAGTYEADFSCSNGSLGQLGLVAAFKNASGGGPSTPVSPMIIA